MDYGHTGETPPIFAQAAGAPLVYIANELPSPKGEAILVAKDSPIQKVADLKGKKVALNKRQFDELFRFVKSDFPDSKSEPVILAVRFNF